jgi:hypothetical protein
LADAVPVERRLAANVQALELSLQKRDARVQGRRIVGTAIDAARQPLEPARPDIVDGQVGRYPEAGEVLGRQRGSGRQMGMSLFSLSL